MCVCVCVCVCGCGCFSTHMPAFYENTGMNVVIVQGTVILTVCGVKYTFTFILFSNELILLS